MAAIAQPSKLRFSGVVPGVAARAEDGDKLAVARIVMDMGPIEILLFRSALGTAVTGKREQCFAITAPFRAVVLAQLGADRHCVHYGKQGRESKRFNPTLEPDPSRGVLKKEPTRSGCICGEW